MGAWPHSRTSAAAEVGGWVATPAHPGGIFWVQFAGAALFMITEVIMINDYDYYKSCVIIIMITPKAV